MTNLSSASCRPGCSHRVHSAILLLLSLALGACATRHGYLREPDHPIRNVRVSDRITVPEQMDFAGVSEWTVYGAAVAAQFAGIGVSSATAFQRAAVTHYQLPESLQAAFETEIRRQTQFGLSSGLPIDAEFRLTVVSYGFGLARPLSRRLRPVLSVHARMVRSDGLVIWESMADADSADLPDYFPEALFNRPILAEHALRVVAERVAAKLVANLMR